MATEKPVGRRNEWISCLSLYVLLATFFGVKIVFCSSVARVYL